MTTQTIMLAEIEADTERTAAAEVTAMRNKIAAAIRQYQPTRFFFNESRSTTFSTVAATAKYSWATIGKEFYAIDGVFVTDGSNVIEVTRTNYLNFETPNTSQSRPDAYAFVDGGLIFWPTPDDVYSMRVDGHIKIAAPASDDEASNPWMTEAYDLIMSRAKAELYAHHWEDPAYAQVMLQAEESALKRLTRATTSKAATGTLTPTQF
jgi:hypothetical protein